MKLIIGGAYQAKSEYAKTTFPKIEWTDCRKLDYSSIKCVGCVVRQLPKEGGILHFQEIIRFMIENHIDYSELAEKMIENCPDTIITVQEVGYGVVPIDAIDREYREAVGRISTKLASYSDQVIRVVCGIGTIIK